jgi:hypothetical protein
MLIVTLRQLRPSNSSRRRCLPPGIERDRTDPIVMLQAQCRAPESTISPLQMAQQLSFKSFTAARLHYDTFARAARTSWGMRLRRRGKVRPAGGLLSRPFETPPTRAMVNSSGSCDQSWLPRFVS